MITAKPLFEGSDWDFGMLSRIWDAVEPIALEDLGLNLFLNEFRVITYEQMLDAYASIGMPHMYKHWSFGKRFTRDYDQYRKGISSLAYELVINSDPCINYLMEENSAAMQALVIAHAGAGHNHFFKNNYLFREWTQPDFILDYLSYAAKYIAKCEERYGEKAVELVLDSAHALMGYGIDRSKRPAQLSQEKRVARLRQRQQAEEEQYDDLWARTVPRPAAPAEQREEEIAPGKKAPPRIPEENLLYFFEKYSPSLVEWEREVVRIVRTISQYFYPQRQTKMMNEGCATFVHHHILTELSEKGLITPGAMQEILHSHSSVIFQPSFNKPYFSGINPYALGFAMMSDIKRIAAGIDPRTGKECSNEQLAEDREYFPHLAGSGDWRAALRDAWENYRDESFVMQFLSPKVARDFRLFAVHHGHHESEMTVRHIHDEEGFRGLRATLASMYNISEMDPDIQVIDANFAGDRGLRLLLKSPHNRRLEAGEAERTMQLMHQKLWAYPINLDMETAENKVIPAFSIANGEFKKLA